MPILASRKRLLILAPALTLLLALALWRIGQPRPRITAGNAPIAKSNFHFIPEHWQESRLRQLREQETFKDIVHQGELDLLLKLCDWTHRQWQTSIPDPYPLSNAIDILADIRSGKTGGFCGQYAYVLADVLKSLGFFAVRYVELWSARGESHFVVEAWSDQYGKWLVLDPTENLFYVSRDSGRPANALEVRAALLGPRVVVARSAGMPRIDLGEKKMHLYAHFAVSTRSDLMRLDKPLTVQDRFATFVFFRDSATGTDAFAGRIPYDHVSSRVEDVYFDCNHVRVEHQVDRKQKTITFQFFTDGSMFNFDAFAVSADRGKSWERSQGEYRVPVPTQPRSFWVAAVNMAGRFGRPTPVQIDPN